MDNQHLVEKWIDVARWTPSADNTQPWQARCQSLSNEDLVIHLIRRGPEKTSSPLQSAVQNMALGSFYSSLTLAAREDGFHVTQNYPIEQGWAVHLHKNQSTELGWRDLIVQRHTNRRPYFPQPLAPSEVAFVEQVVSRFNGIHIDDLSARKSAAARLLAKLDRIRYQNNLHLNHLLEVLRFNAGAEEGLDVKTLEIPWAAVIIFRLLKRFHSLRVIFFLGLERIFSLVGCRFLIEKSAHFYLLRATDQSADSWFHIGRCFQEIWLEATRRNLALQPFGHTFIANEAAASDGSLSPQHRELVSEVQREFLKLRPEAHLARAGIFFRLGKPCSLPQVRSRRRSLKELLRVDGSP